uniref:NADH-ubiquinone oxidoreductase chain 2 n=1 Tax=Salinator rhamphidia TaxID=981055 RepID=G8HR57_9GAST|nr:NADH dehydrogenase subunit 2 [Salinator rhamphidia]AEQ93898.1 NADH dehydrogenase subunit 2 [Salinator rhamphidia]
MFGASNVLFLLLMIIGPIITLSSSNWVVSWAGMELGFVGLIPLLFLGVGSVNKEVGMKYFCIQALASALLFVSGMMIFSLFQKGVFWVLGMIFSLCLKLGLFPGHFWVPSVVSGLDWFSCVLILGPLKIGPFAFLSNIMAWMPSFHPVVLFLGGMSTVIGGVLGNNQTSVRAMLGSSSIAHSGWITLGSVVGGLWLYFLFYYLVLVLSLIFLSELDYSSVCIAFLSMSGLPPFLMFVAKLKIVTMMMGFSWWMLFILLPLAGSVLSLIFYLKLSYSFYLNTKSWPSISGGLGFMVVNCVGIFWGVFFM